MNKNIVQQEIAPCEVGIMVQQVKQSPVTLAWHVSCQFEPWLLHF